MKFPLVLRSTMQAKVDKEAEDSLSCMLNLSEINNKLNKRCKRDDKLIFKMKDEISKLKMTVNDLRQKQK